MKQNAVTTKGLVGITLSVLTVCFAWCVGESFQRMGFEEEEKINHYSIDR